MKVKVGDYVKLGGGSCNCPDCEEARTNFHQVERLVGVGNILLKGLPSTEFSINSFWTKLSDCLEND